MKKITTLFLALIFAGLAATAQNDQQKANRVDSILSVFTKKNMFCGSVLIAKKGKVLLSKGYGMANYSYDIPNSGTTKFKLASVSKQFTAMAIMILQEKGKLSTEDKLDKYWPEYKYGNKITIYNLLTHTSGIKNFTEIPAYDTLKNLPQTLEGEIAMVKNLPLEFEPGEKFNYSNTGYLLLSYIIEKASGKNYGEFVQEVIFTPLGMKNSGLYPTNSFLKNEAVGYHSEEDGLRPADYINMSVPAGAGALYSTVEDLYLWDRALYTEKLVKKATIEKIFTPFKDNYACGWKTDDYNGHKWMFHTGGIEGFSTVISRFPDDELSIIMLKNVDNYSLFAANRTARQVMFGEKYELPVERKIAKVDPAVYKKLVGDYELMPGFVMSISTTGNKVYAQATGQPQLEIYPEEEYRYFVKVVDAQFEFSKDENGNVNALTLFQGGAKMPGKKIK